MTSKMAGNHEIIDLTGDQEDTAEYFPPVRLYTRPYGIITKCGTHNDHSKINFAQPKEDGNGFYIVDDDNNFYDSISVGWGDDAYTSPSTLKSSSKDLAGLSIVAIEYHPFHNGKPYKGDGEEKPNSGPVFFLNDLSNKGKKPAILYSVRNNGSPGPIWTTAQGDCGDVFELEN